MEIKLTLSLDASVLSKAKQYAKSQNMTLSKLVEMYLISLKNKQMEDMKISSIVEELTGVISLEEDDYRKVYTDYLINNHLK